jgi:hypothetical protein
LWAVLFLLLDDWLAFSSTPASAVNIHLLDIIDVLAKSDLQCDDAMPAAITTVTPSTSHYEAHSMVPTFCDNLKYDQAG